MITTVVLAILVHVAQGSKDTRDGYRWILQDMKRNESKTCHDSCKEEEMICDFAGIQVVPNNITEHEIVLLLPGFGCAQSKSNSTLIESDSSVHNNTNEPYFNVLNNCTYGYKEIGRHYPECSASVSSHLKRLCRCRFMNYKLVLQKFPVVNLQTCTETCAEKNLTCDFKGMENIKLHHLESMLVALIPNVKCGDLPNTLATSDEFKYHRGETNPVYTIRNNCTTGYVGIAQKGPKPECSLRSNEKSPRICRCFVERQPEGAVITHTVTENGINTKRQPESATITHTVTENGINTNRQLESATITHTVTENGINTNSQPLSATITHKVTENGKNTKRPPLSAAINHTVIENGINITRQPVSAIITHTVIQNGINTKSQPLSATITHSTENKISTKRQPVSAIITHTVIQNGINTKSQPLSATITHSIENEISTKTSPISTKISTISTTILETLPVISTPSLITMSTSSKFNSSNSKSLLPSSGSGSRSVEDKSWIAFVVLKIVAVLFCCATFVVVPLWCRHREISKSIQAKSQNNKNRRKSRRSKTPSAIKNDQIPHRISFLPDAVSDCQNKSNLESEPDKFSAVSRIKKLPKVKAKKFQENPKCN